MEACDCRIGGGLRCERCLATTIATLSGTAEARGWEHAATIAGAALGERWRTSEDQALRRARPYVEDISAGDERLVSAFALFACKGAGRRWRSGV